MGKELSSDSKLVFISFFTKKYAALAQRLIDSFRKFGLDYCVEELPDYGAWYKSLYASSDPYSGYASWMLPGFLYLASNKETDKIAAWEDRYAKSFQQLNEEIKVINELLKKGK
jgi:hypothetical protein